MTLYDDVPELIEPIEVKFEQIDKGSTPYSSGLSGRREIINHVERDVEKTIQAQVVFGNVDQKTVPQEIGADEQVKGYLVVRYQDMLNLGVDLERGDKITQLGQLEVEYFLLHSQGDPAAHFTSIGGFTLTRLFFSDRTPVK